MAVTIKKKGEFITEPPLLTHHVSTTKSKPKNPFRVRSYAITAETEEILAHLKQQATDHIGRPISSSALLRALVNYLGQQPSSWTVKELHPLIEAEIEQGHLWGTKGKSHTPQPLLPQIQASTPSQPGKGKKQKGKRT